MKRILAIMLIGLLMLAGGAEAPQEMKLTAEITGTNLTEKWDGQTSQEVDWFLVNVHLTNWHIETQSIADQVSGVLVFRDIYRYDGMPAFDGETIAPLVEKDGSLVFEIPKLISRSFTPEDVHVTITVDGVTQTVDPEMKSARISEQRSGTLEGPGFDTPEEAVLAYLDALNDGNVSGMLSTFAIESYIDHVNPVSGIRRLYQFAFNALSTLPQESEYARNLAVNARYGELADRLLYQYAEITTESGGSPIRVMKDNTLLQELIVRFQSSPANGWQGNVEFTEWIDPDSLSEVFMTENNSRNIARSMAINGAEDYVEMVAHIRLNGTDALQTMKCINYGGRWYNFDPLSTIATILGVDPSMEGLAVPYGEYGTNVQELLKGAAIAAADPWESSNMLSTRWKLVSLNLPGLPGISVGENRNSVDADSGKSVYAELCFAHHGGALVYVYFSPALLSATGEESQLFAREEFVGVWTPSNGGADIGGIQSAHGQVKLTLDSVACRLDGDRLLLQTSDGYQAVLERLDD